MSPINLNKLLYTLLLITATLIPLVFNGSAKANPPVVSEENRSVEDVIGAFDSLTHHGEWLGFHMGDPFTGEFAPDTAPCPTDEHVQGIARSPQMGTPIFYVTRSGNIEDPDYYGSLMVVEMGTRETDGERLRSNRLLKGDETRTTPPHTMDRVIKNIEYSDWEHPGGVQMVGDVLTVPLEKPSNIYLPQGRIIFYDCSDPGNPQKLSYELDFPDHHVGVLGITRLPDGHFIMIVTWGNNDTIQFYRSNETSFFAPGFQFERHPVSPVSFINLIANGYWIVDDGDSMTRGDYPFQTLNFINQSDGHLYLIASRNNDGWAPISNGDDLMYLIEVTGFGEGEIIEFQGIRKDAHKQLSSEGCWNTWGKGKWCGIKPIYISENIQGNFNAGAGAYISPSGELLYYATSHYNRGPYNTIKMAELRHNFVSSSGTCGPKFQDNHLGGPYSIDAGANITLNGTANFSGHRMMPWVQMFADSNFQGPMVMMDFPDQLSDDYNDFSNLDGCLTPAPDGFNDQLSSFRFNGPPGSVLMLFDDDNYRFGNTSYPPVPGTGKVIEVPFVGLHFNDEATSALLLWNGYSDQPYSWDLDNDGEFDDAYGPIATFQASSGNSTNIVRMKYVYNDAWVFNGLGFPISFPATYAIFETVINVGSVTLTVDAGPDATIDEGDTFSSSGSFTDLDTDTWTATVDYGDGSGAQLLTLNSDKTFNLSHLYLDNGAYTVTVTVNSGDGDQGIDAAMVTVNNVAPMVDAGSDISTSSGQTIKVDADFVDPGVNDNPWCFTIDWGDNSTVTTGSSDIQGADTITGTHQYSLPGIYTVIVTVIDKDGGIGSDTLQIEVDSLRVEIDIKPGSDVNTINPDSKGVIPVAILTDGDFDATTVRGNTCRFGPGQAAPRHYAFKDVDNDGDLDIILHFPTQATDLSFNDTQATLTGQTYDDTYISGTDVVRIVPSKEKKEPKGKDDAPGQNKDPGESANGKGKDDAPGQNKDPGEPANGKGKDDAPGQNKDPREPANGKGKDDAPGQKK
ncbi:MAG: hypothetical protein JSU79_09735 [Dehalococcoidales bacterium]|nr:MAG: hypothetical protein JSU79_09735 [Dehalococcoidales bacterium]